MVRKLCLTRGLGRSAYRFQPNTSVEEQLLPKSGLSQLLTALIISRYMWEEDTVRFQGGSSLSQDVRYNVTYLFGFCSIRSF